MRKKLNQIKNYIQKNDIIFLVILTITFELFIYFLGIYIENIKYAVIPLLFLNFSILFVDNKNSKKKKFYFVYMLGILLRTFYILKTNVYTRQHDVGLISEFGHLGYIYYIYYNSRLPLTNIGQFYHPPLWHILASFWLVLNKFLKVEMYISLEGIQILSLLFSSVIIIIVNNICIKIKLKEKYKNLMLLFFAVHPTLIILSGSINNDILVTFFEFLLILVLINWQEKITWKNTIFLAIITGLCVMSKFNGVLMAIPIIYTIIEKLKVYKNKKELKEFLKKIFVFIIISIPIGTWYQIRNLIKFNNNSIPGAIDWLYIGDNSLIDRFLKLNFKELFNYVQITSDYNLPSYIIKSSLFGEYSFDILNIFKFIFILLNLILIIISIFFTIRYLVKDRKNKIINILVVTWFVNMISMYIFNYKYPFTCSMDYRYIVITLLPGIMMIGYSLNELKNKKIRLSIEIMCYLFIITCIIFNFMI